MRPIVMIVEDNPITRKMVTFTLESQGFSVVDAPDAATALSAFPLRHPALVLQDLLLPDMDGVELVRRLRALPGGAEVPILAFSGMLSKGDEARFSAAGFDDIITKPVEPSRLVQIVRTHLPADEPATPVAVGRRQILLADDDPVQRKLAAFRLTKAGYDVITAADGQEALERAREKRPDAIVSDVLMPRLDGFGLCMAVRSDPALASVPIVLATNSYLENADRELARRAGATDLVLRTPELREVLTALASLGTGAAPAAVAPTPIDPGLEHERVQRVMKQLERQVALNAGANQRCALLSAELSVLSAISEAVATQHDIDAALRQALAACFDAGGISVGALYIVEGDRRRVMKFGAVDAWAREDVDGLFGAHELLERAIESQVLLSLPSAEVPADVSDAILGRARGKSLLLAPLGHQGERLGALLMVSRTTDLHAEDRVVFALAVAGQISLALALARAFAAKDAAARAARSHAAVLGSTLESMADAVVVSDPAGAISSWNPAAEAILGPRAGHDPRGWVERGLFAADQVTPLAPELHPLARAQRGEAVDQVELFLRHPGKPDGAWLSISARPLDDEAIGGAVAVIRDVTADKAAAAQLMVSDRMASLGSLAAGVAHEINNPLAAVLGNLDLAVGDVSRLEASGVEAGELREELADARHAADRVRQIVRDLKLFSRAEEDRRGPVDVERVLESSLRMAWTEIRHRARLVRDYAKVPPVDANEARLGQVFLNLIVNAAHAIPEGRAMMNEIRVATRLDGNRVRVEIADTGHGMSPEVLARLFTPFFTTKPPGVGTGLGLSICRRLLTAIGGEIEVDSAVGKGTVFILRLPVVSGAEVAVEPGPVPVEPAPRRGRILVVDDDPAISSVVTRVLGRHHDVVGLTDATEAIRRIAAGERYDVILCDLMMPTVTGLELHAELARTAPDQSAAMVFMTGGAFTPQARATLESLPNPRVEKPFDLDALRRLINERL